MVETYNGKSPRNARIKIDYTGQKPSVNFTYPRKDGYVGSLQTELFLVWFIFLTILWIGFSLGMGLGFSSGISTLETNETLNETNVEKICSLDEKFIFITKSDMSVKEKINNIFYPIKILIIVLLIFIAPPKLVNKIFKKKLSALFPVYMAWRSTKKYVVFKNKDIKESTINGKKEIYVEIPFFDNVILNYEATKDFSKYLEVMEIREHNFKTQKHCTKKKKKVKKQNEWYWMARFYFSEKPKTGKLEVIFK